jgi:hypothetical protein
MGPLIDWYVNIFYILIFRFLIKVIKREGASYLRVGHEIDDGFEGRVDDLSFIAREEKGDEKEDKVEKDCEKC